MEIKGLRYNHPLLFLCHSLLSLNEQNELLNPRRPGVQTDPLSTRQTGTEHRIQIDYINEDFSLQVKRLGSVQNNEWVY